MNPDNIATLNKHRLVLVRDMDASSVVDSLLSDKILLNQHEQEIAVRLPTTVNDRTEPPSNRLPTDSSKH